MAEKRRSVMVLPRSGNKILLQSFNDSSGSLVWDGYGSFYKEGEDPISTAEKVFSDNFSTPLTPEQLHLRAQLNYQINKPDGSVDLDVTVYSADVTEDLEVSNQNRWFEPGEIPYAKMHQATGKWLPLLLEQADPITAQIKVEQPGDHTKGEVTEFTLQ